MLKEFIADQAKIHSRDIRLATYEYSARQVIVQGILEDQRYRRTHDVTGYIKEPSVVHHMEVRLLIRADPLTIELAEADMYRAPLDECRATLDNLAKLEGLEVKRGFSKEVALIMGGANGCTHLSKLIAVMGQEIVHGWLTNKRQRKPELPPDMDSLKEKGFLYNSCRMWSNQGPKYRALEEAIKKQRTLESWE